MTRKEAVLAAATHLAKHPETFDYGCIDVPASTASCGCAIGWVAFFKGTNGECLDDKAKEALGVTYWKTFEGRMEDILGKSLSLAGGTAVAKALRKYAKVYLS